MAFSSTFLRNEICSIRIYLMLCMSLNAKSRLDFVCSNIKIAARKFIVSGASQASESRFINIWSIDIEL